MWVTKELKLGLHIFFSLFIQVGGDRGREPGRIGGGRGTGGGKGKGGKREF